MKADAEFWNLLAGCTRTIMFSLTGQIIILMICNRMLDRRRGTGRLMLCLMAKSIWTAIFVDTILQHYYPDSAWVDLLGVISSAVMMLLCYIPLVHTYYGGLLKCIWAVNIAEIITSSIILPCFILFSYLGDRNTLFVIYGNLQVTDFMCYLTNILTGIAFCHIAKPILDKFRIHQIRHKKTMSAIAIVYISSVQLMAFGDIQNVSGTMVYIYIVFLLYEAAILIIFIMVNIHRRKKVRIENTFLNMQLHLMESHYTSLQKQIHQMEDCQRIIDEQMKEIVDRNGLQKGKTSAYLERLKQSYNEIRAGIYCNDWMVDAVLYCQSETARSQGISVEYSLSEYNRGKTEENEIVYILIRLFDYGIRENQNAREGAEKRISLRMGTVLNHLVIDFYTTAGKNGRGAA